MPKRTDIKSILIIGAGPIVIGQACEFDYSGAQACKALREEGYRVILVNSNPATIMTDPETADAIYIEPVNWRTVARIIQRERPDALLPTMGGQTGLNTALDLVREGVLKQYNVELIAASRAAIDMAEDRERFRNAMREIGLAVPHSQAARSLEEALAVQGSIGYPIVIRPSFTLGGSGGGIAYNREEFETIVQRGLDTSPTRELLLEESVLGWKEYELEVVRDAKDNCIIVCSIENIDPMGVHTGRPRTDADRQGVPAHARCGDRRAAQDRRRDRRLQRAVRSESAGRAAARDRDEPAGLALLGAGLEGHGVSNREGRGQARGRLYAR
jgi:carbamoyl-phosphate synthase large subunit